MIIGIRLSPFYNPHDTVFPCFHTATCEGGHCGSIRTHKPLTARLYHSVDEDGVPMNRHIKQEEKHMQKYSPSTVKFDCSGMIKGEPALCPHAIPPCRILFVTCHDNVFHCNSFTLQKFCFHLFHAASYHGERRETEG